MSYDFFSELNRVAKASEKAKPTAAVVDDFDLWYARLLKSSSALSRSPITLTADNFRKAMRQAYYAGQNQD